MAPKRKKGDPPPEEPSIIEKISSYLANPFRHVPVPKTPVSGSGERVKHMMKNNFRGIIGVIVPLLTLAYQFKRFEPKIKMWLMWQWMGWFYLVQPIAVPCTSMIPIFYLPMVGIYNSLDTCKCYMNEGIMLYITSSYVLVLLNNSGIDKRVSSIILSIGDASKFSGKMLVLKASTAAFFLSIFSSRLIATQNLTQTITSAFEKIESAPGQLLQISKTPDIPAMRHVVNNAIQTSATIGSLVIIHSSWVTLVFRACYQECVPKEHENPDIFNYMQYSVFAFPVAFVMFIANLIYHIVLMMKFEGKGMGGLQTEELRSTILSKGDEIPVKISLHELYSVLFTIIILGALFTRNNKYMSGWALPVENLEEEPSVYRVKDTTVTAVFVILLHSLPKSFGFVKLFFISRRDDLPPAKPESAIMWWRFVDRNVNYGYMYTFGSAIALLRAGFHCELSLLLMATVPAAITDQSWPISLFICILLSAVLCNIMPGMAACSIFLPFIMLLAGQSQIPWSTHYFIPALGIGLACNLGFCVPFQYTPAYYCHHTGRVPILSMVKYSIPSVLICSIVIFGGVYKYAPTMFDTNFLGVTPIPVGQAAKDSLQKRLQDLINQQKKLNDEAAASKGGAGGGGGGQPDEPPPP